MGFVRAFLFLLAECFQSLFQADVAGIERLADDGTFHSELLEHFQVEQGGDTAGGDDGHGESIQ